MNLIPVYIGLAVLCGILCLASLQVVLRTAARARQLFESLTILEKNIETKSPSREIPTQELERILTENVTSPTVIDRVHALRSLKDCGSHIDPVALAEGTSHALRQRLTIPRLFANVMVLLGLVGAVLGITTVCWKLSLTVKKYMVNLGSEDHQALIQQAIDNQNKLLNEMSSSLHETSNAFLLSLCGLVGTILVMAMIAYATTLIDSALSRLELLTQQKLLPLFSATTEASAQARVVDAFLESARALTEVSQRMRDKAALVEDQINDLYVVVTTFRDGAANLGRMTEHVDALRSQIETSHTGLSRTMEAFDQQVRQLGEMQKEQASSLVNSLVEANRSAGDQMARAISGEIRESRQQQSTEANSFLQAIVELKSELQSSEVTREIRESRQQQRAESNQVIQALAELKSELKSSEITREIRESRQQQSADSNLVIQALAELKSEWKANEPEKLTSALANQLQRSLQEPLEAMKQSQEQLGEKTLNALRDLQDETRNSRGSEIVTIKLEALQQEIQRLGATFREAFQSSDLSAPIREAMGQLTEQLGRLPTSGPAPAPRELPPAPAPALAEGALTPLLQALEAHAKAIASAAEQTGQAPRPTQAESKTEQRLFWALSLPTLGGLLYLIGLQIADGRWPLALGGAGTILLGSALWSKWRP